LILLTVAVVTGCGGGTTTVAKTTQTSHASTITLPAESAAARARYIARADRICFRHRGRAAHFQHQLARLADAPSSTENDRKAATVMRNAGQLLSEVLDLLGRLSPPPGDEAAIRAYFDAMRQEIDLVNKEARALEALDASRVRHLDSQLRNAISEVKQIARGYGFRACGSA